MSSGETMAQRGASRVRAKDRDVRRASRGLGAAGLVIACAIALGSCAGRVRSPRATPAIVDARGNLYCSPPIPLEAEFVEDETPAAASRTERLAALLGLHETYEKLHHDPSSVSAEEHIAALERVSLASALVDAIVAELDCEGERADQVSAYLRARDDRRRNALTISSILTGAGAAIATSVLAGSDSSGAEQWVGGIGGGTSAALALGLLFVGSEIDFHHERNLLADIWNGPEVSSLYPPFLWAYLSRPGYANDQRDSIRSRIVARWRAFHAQANDPELAALLFGQGGRYDAATLQLRATLLEQIKAEVALTSQDLATLESAIFIVREHAAP